MSELELINVDPPDIKKHTQFIDSPIARRISFIVASLFSAMTSNCTPLTRTINYPSAEMAQAMDRCEALEGDSALSESVIIQDNIDSVRASCYKEILANDQNPGPYIFARAAYYIRRSGDFPGYIDLCRDGSGKYPQDQVLSEACQFSEYFAGLEPHQRVQNQHTVQSNIQQDVPEINQTTVSRDNQSVVSHDNLQPPPQPSASSSPSTSNTETQPITGNDAFENTIRGMILGFMTTTPEPSDLLCDEIMRGRIRGFNNRFYCSESLIVHRYLNDTDSGIKLLFELPPNEILKNIYELRIVPVIANGAFRQGKILTARYLFAFARQNNLQIPSTYEVLERILEEEAILNNEPPRESLFNNLLSYETPIQALAFILGTFAIRGNINPENGLLYILAAQNLTLDKLLNMDWMERYSRSIGSENRMFMSLYIIGFYKMGDHENAAKFLRSLLIVNRALGRRERLDDEELSSIRDDLSSRGFDLSTPPPRQRNIITDSFEGLRTFVQEHPIFTVGLTVAVLYFQEQRAASRREEQERQRLASERRVAELRWRNEENQRRARLGIPSLEEEEARENQLAESRRIQERAECDRRIQQRLLTCLGDSNRYSRIDDVIYAQNQCMGDAGQSSCP